MSVSESELKDAVKSAMAEAIVEQRALLRDIIEEVIEDIAPVRAIDDGRNTPSCPAMKCLRPWMLSENSLSIQFPQRLKHLKTVREKRLRSRLKEVIESIEKADALTNLQSLKQLKGEKRYYRIRIGEYRLGLRSEDDTVTLVRFLHWKEIYRYFP